MAEHSDFEARIRNDFARAAARLADAGVADEALAEFIPARRVALIFARQASMRPLGRVWRLGVLLVDANGNAYATGRITRARRVGRPNYHAVSAEERRVERGAALRAGYREGEVVNLGAQAIDPSHPQHPIVIHNGDARVLWVATASPDAAPSLGDYLDERVGLLISPPDGV